MKSVRSCPVYLYNIKNGVDKIWMTKIFKFFRFSGTYYFGNEKFFWRLQLIIYQRQNYIHSICILLYNGMEFSTFWVKVRIRHIFYFWWWFLYMFRKSIDFLSILKRNRLSLSIFIFWLDLWNFQSASSYFLFREISFSFELAEFEMCLIYFLY